MYDADKMLIYKRDGFPNGIDTVIDTYEFKPDARNGQVRKVIVMIRDPKQAAADSNAGLP